MRLCSLALAATFLVACEPGDEPPTGTWELPLKGLDGALLSVWGRGPADIWTVGADVGDGPNVLHYDGARWTRLTPGTTGSLWWVAGVGDAIWMAGDGGTVLRYDIPANNFEEHPTPTPERLYGILPFSDSDVWAVGANPQANAGVIYHFDGSDWSVPPGLTPALTDGLGFFKVWGRSTDDVWIVGDGDAALHWSGGAWERIAVPGKLFTVHGDGDLVIGVGGSVSGKMVELVAGAATDVTPMGEVYQQNGVYVGADATVSVGAEGSVWRRQSDGTWTLDEDTPETPLGYHSVYVDPDGGLWAVGGQLTSEPPTQGILGHFGQPVQSTTIEE